MPGPGYVSARNLDAVAVGCFWEHVQTYRAALQRRRGAAALSPSVRVCDHVENLSSYTPLHEHEVGRLVLFSRSRYWPLPSLAVVPIYLMAYFSFSPCFPLYHFCFFF